MILCLAHVLSADDLARLDEHLRGEAYTDGRATAGWHARLVKRNEQLGRGPAAETAGGMITEALRKNPVFRAGVLPRTIRPPLFSRYTPDMAYGSHVDNALMGETAPVRSDVSVTVFLSAPETYEGGALVIESTGGEQAFKLDAGSAIAYPSTTLHRIEPVTAGERTVAVTWVESHVRAAEQREILFDLETARTSLFRAGGKSRDFDLLSKTHANLLRLWAET